jgi:hypothetical protein
MAIRTKSPKVRSRRARWLIKGIAVLLVVILSTASWAGFRWLKFIEKHQGEPYKLGVSFSLKYARELGVDWQSTFTALMDEMGVRRLRLMSYWDDIERVRGEYRFEQLDWQFREAEARGAKVSLAIGLRQPRWPECHAPEWAKELERNNYNEWRRELDEFIVAVVNRYKDSPALISWQLENEALNTAFGICHDHDRQRLEDEFQLVKRHDQRVPVMVSVSNEFGLPLGKPKGDIVGFSVYKRVFENRFLKTYFNYPLPARWHGVRAAIVERYLGQPVVIHELQAEPWGPDQTWNLTIEEQNKSMDAKRVKKHADYAMRSGIREMYFWGGEWWYWRKHKLGDPTVWETAKAIFAEQQR